MESTGSKASGHTPQPQRQSSQPPHTNSSSVAGSSTASPASAPSSWLDSSVRPNMALPMTTTTTTPALSLSMPLPSPPADIEAQGRDGSLGCGSMPSSNLVISALITGCDPATPFASATAMQALLHQQRQQQQQQAQARGSPMLVPPPPVRTQSDPACFDSCFSSWGQQQPPERELTHSASDSSGTSDAGSAPSSATGSGGCDSGSGGANSLSPDPLLELESGMSELMQPLPAFQDSISKWLERSRSVMQQKTMQQRTTGSIGMLALTSTSAPQGSATTLSPSLFSSALPLTRSITAQLPVSAATFASYAKHPGTFSQLGLLVSSMTSSSYAGTPASAGSMGPASATAASSSSGSSFSAHRKERHHGAASASSGPSSAAGSVNNTPMHLNSAQVPQPSSNPRRTSGGAATMAQLSQSQQQQQQQHPATATHRPNPVFRFDAPAQNVAFKHAAQQQQLPVTGPSSSSSNATAATKETASPATTASDVLVQPPNSPPRRATPPSALAQRPLALQRQRSAGAAALPSLAESSESALAPSSSSSSSSSPAQPAALRRNAALVPHLQLPVVQSGASGASEDSIFVHVSSPASPGTAPSARRSTATASGSGATPKSHRRSPSAALPAQPHAMPAPTTAHAKILAPRLSRSGSSSLRDMHALHNLHSASPMPSASPGLTALGSSSHAAPLHSQSSSSLRADSLEDAWRRKICLNMNLVPESGSGGHMRSPLSAKPLGSRSTRGTGPAATSHLPFSMAPVSKKCHSQPGTPMIGAIEPGNGGSHAPLQFPRASVSRSGGGGGKLTRGTSGTRTPSSGPVQAHVAVLGAGPARSRVHSDSEHSGPALRPSQTQQLSHSFTQPAVLPESTTATKQDPVPPPPNRTPSLPSDSYSAADQLNQLQQQQHAQSIDWSALCHCLTGEDLDQFEHETMLHLQNYYSLTAENASSSANAVFGSEDASIASLDESIRNMEARKAITLRMRRMGWMVALGFCLAFLGSMGLLLFADDAPFVPTGAFGYFLGAVLFTGGYPWVSRTTRWFKFKPLLPLPTLYRTLNISAGVCAAALFVGALEMHGAPGLHREASVSQTEGWSRWVLCSLPLFVGYVLHDVNSIASEIWWGVSMLAITLSHVINAFWLAAPAEGPGSLRSDSNALRGHGRSQQWIFALSIQLLFCSLNFKVAQAAMVSIQAHRIQLWRREQFMLEQGKHLAQQREEAFSTANQKSQFLANMSHEIRTPLNAIIGLCSLVLESSLTFDQRDCLETVIKSGETLLNIINDILLFSKLESGQLLIENLPFSPMNAVEDVIDMLAATQSPQPDSTGGPADQQQELELIAHFRGNIPCPIWGDVMRLRQLLTNLLSNALKFSRKKGEVIVTVESIDCPLMHQGEEDTPRVESSPRGPQQQPSFPIARPTPSPRHTPVRESADRSPPLSPRGRAPSFTPGPRASPQPSSSPPLPATISESSPAASDPVDDCGLIYLKFSVQDFGCGIPRNKQHRLFHAFSQVDASDTRKYGGTGLGLVIVKRLVELMGGRIGFESEAGKGSTFWFWLPFPTRPPGSMQPVTPGGEADASILAASVMLQMGIAAQDPLATPGAQLTAPVEKPVLSVDVAAQLPQDAVELCSPTRELKRASSGQRASLQDAPSAVPQPDAAGFAVAQQSPSHTFNPSHSFSRFSGRLSGKRLLLVESSARSTEALADLAAVWGMQVTCIHTKAEWKIEWAAICLNAYRRHHTARTANSSHSGSLSSSLQNRRGQSMVISLPSNNAAPTGYNNTPSLEAQSILRYPIEAAFSGSDAGNGVSIGAVSSSPDEDDSVSLQLREAEYDIVLILDSVLADETFIPYAAYNTMVKEKGWSRAIEAQGVCSPAPTIVNAAQLFALEQQLQSSTCSTASSSLHVTPEITARRLSESLSSSGAMAAAAAAAAEWSDGGELIHSAVSSVSAPSTSVRSHSPASTPPLPAFILLLSHTQRHARLDAAKEAAGRGFAGVLPKPVKWKHMLQSLLKACKYKPSAIVLLKAFQSQTSPNHSAGSAHRRALTSVPSSARTDSSHRPASRSRTRERNLDRDHSSSELPSFAESGDSAPSTAQTSPDRMLQRRSISVDGENQAHRPPAHVLASLDLSIPSAASASAVPAAPLALRQHSDPCSSTSSSGVALSSTDSSPQTQWSSSGSPPVTSPHLQAAHSTPCLSAAAPLSASVVAAAPNASAPPLSSVPPSAKKRASASKGGSTGAAALKTPPANASLRILCAEDNVVNQKVVLRMLAHLGYSNVTVANDGAECLQMLEKCNQHRPSAARQTSQDAAAGVEQAAPFDLILMDCSMPRLGGISATRRLRAGLCPCFQPKVVALTANVLPADQDACLEAGQQGFLAKPLLLPQLKSILEACQRIGEHCNYATEATMAQVANAQLQLQGQGSLGAGGPGALLSSLMLQIASPTKTPIISPDAVQLACFPAGMQSPAPGARASSTGSSSSSVSVSSLLPCVCRELWSDQEENQSESM